MDDVQTFDTGPLDREFFAANAPAAKAFLMGLNGTALHEAGHYSAANFDELVPGHIVIARDGPQGAFIFDESKFDAIKSDEDRFGFIAASGALAELFFCDTTEYTRCKADISFYNGFVADVVFEERIFRDTIVEWNLRYAALFSAITENIEENYHRIGALVVSKTYLTDAYHVIPSSELNPPFVRSEKARAEERALTASQEMRSIALCRFLNGRVGAPDRHLAGSRFAASVDKLKSLVMRKRSKR